MSKSQPPQQISVLTHRLASAAFAATLLSGAAVTGAVLLPATATAAVNSDGDGLTDDFEIPNHLDPQNPDSDRDGLLDGEEMRTHHTGPLNQDTDNDGISDGDEVKRYHTGPLVANALPPQAPPTQALPTPKDTDGDGLSDDDEKNVYRTDPNRKDTDRDGRDDGAEVKNRTNPRIPLL